MKLNCPKKVMIVQKDSVVSLGLRHTKCLYLKSKFIRVAMGMGMEWEWDGMGLGIQQIVLF